MTPWGCEFPFLTLLVENQMRKLLCKWFNLVTVEDHQEEMTQCVTAFRKDIYSIIDGGIKGKAVKLSYTCARDMEGVLWFGDPTDFRFNHKSGKQKTPEQTKGLLTNEKSIPRKKR
jgi:hypothetical protein